MDGNNSSIDNSSLFSITAGSYEGSLFVWDVTKNDNNDLQTKMTAGFHCCVGSIKAIAVSESGDFQECCSIKLVISNLNIPGNCLVCGGMDEKIRIFNMKDKKSTGELSTHTGAITSLKFYKDSHLLSGSEDSTICIWRMYDWACIHILGGHKGPVHDISIHPSGKLALSVSRDKTMKIWNLIEGRIAFTRRLSGAAERVLWSEDGTYYLLVFQKEVQVYVAEDNSLTCTLQHDLRVNQALFLQHPPPTPQISLATAVAAADGGGGGGVVKEAMTGTGMGMGMVVVTISECDGGSLNVFDLTGNKVGTWHLGDVLGGRPKDMSLSHYQQQHIPVPVSTNTSTTTTAASSTTNGYHTAVVIVSSTGTILTVCGDKLMAGKVSREALLSVVSTTAEPRFTCVSVWNNSHT
eukprot:gene10841-22625_t